MGEADGSIEKRKESRGDERARRWIGVSARSDPRGSLIDGALEAREIGAEQSLDWRYL